MCSIGHLVSPIFSMHIVMRPITGQESPNGQINCYGSLKMGPAGFICFWGIVYDSKFKKKVKKNLEPDLAVFTLKMAKKVVWSP